MDRLVYLDNAATKQLSNEFFAQKKPFFRGICKRGTVSSFSLKARLAVEQSRSRVADRINARKERICFTSGGPWPTIRFFG